MPHDEGHRNAKEPKHRKCKKEGPEGCVLLLGDCHDHEKKDSGAETP